MNYEPMPWSIRICNPNVLNSWICNPYKIILFRITNAHTLNYLIANLSKTKFYRIINTYFNEQKDIRFQEGGFGGGDGAADGRRRLYAFEWERDGDFEQHADHSTGHHPHGGNGTVTAGAGAEVAMRITGSGEATSGLSYGRRLTQSIFKFD